MSTSSIKSPSNTISLICDILGLLAIGFCTVIYSISGRFFAEMHINLPFLSFPIFIGEILMAFCFVLLFIKWRADRIQWQWWHTVIVIYVLWIILKAFLGYRVSGALALRNAAMFYYPLCILFGYYFFNPHIFKQWVIALILCLTLFLLYKFTSIGYYNLPYLFFALLLIINFKNIWMKALGSIALAVIFPFSALFKGGRSFTIATFTGLFFVVACFVFGFLRGKRILQICVTGAVLLVITLGLSMFANKNKLQTLLDPVGVLQAYNDSEESLKVLLKNYSPKQIQPKAYNPEKDSFLEYVFGKPEERILSSKASFVDAQAQLIEVVTETVEEEPAPIIEQKSAGAVKKPSTSQAVIDENAQRKVKQDQELAQINDKATVIISSSFADLQAKLIVFLADANDLIKSRGSSVIKDIVKETQQKGWDEINRTFEEIDGKLKSLYQDARYLDKDEINSILERTKDNMRAAQEKLNFEYGANVQVTCESKDIGVEYTNMMFRLHIWRDIWDDLWQQKAFIQGVSFGRPLRSKRIEVLRLAWGEWTRDGWIAAHNSYFHMIYRGGVVGMAVIGLLFFTLGKLIKRFFSLKSATGIFGAGIIVYWLALAPFLVILELPYNAIPIWTFFGLLLAYDQRILSKDKA